MLCESAGIRLIDRSGPHKSLSKRALFLFDHIRLDLTVFHLLLLILGHAYSLPPDFLQEFVYALNSLLFSKMTTKLFQISAKGLLFCFAFHSLSKY